MLDFFASAESATSALGGILNLTLAAAATVTDREQEAVDYWLPLINALVFILIFGLIVFSLAIRYIAIRTTHPCHWCMEFIGNRETECPRCGRSVVPYSDSAVREKRVSP